METLLIKRKALMTDGDPSKDSFKDMISQTRLEFLRCAWEVKEAGAAAVESAKAYNVYNKRMVDMTEHLGKGLDLLEHLENHADCLERELEQSRR